MYLVLRYTGDETKTSEKEFTASFTLGVVNRYVLKSSWCRCETSGQELTGVLLGGLAEESHCLLAGFTNNLGTWLWEERGSSAVPGTRETRAGGQGVAILSGEYPF